MAAEGVDGFCLLQQKASDVVHELVAVRCEGKRLSPPVCGSSKEVGSDIGEVGLPVDEGAESIIDTSLEEALHGNRSCLESYQES